MRFSRHGCQASTFLYGSLQVMDEQLYKAGYQGTAIEAIRLGEGADYQKILAAQHRSGGLRSAVTTAWKAGPFSSIVRKTCVLLTSMRHSSMC
jgi:hypothetical protein